MVAIDSHLNSHQFNTTNAKSNVSPVAQAALPTFATLNVTLPRMDTVDTTVSMVLSLQLRTIFAMITLAAFTRLLFNTSSTTCIAEPLPGWNADSVVESDVRMPVALSIVCSELPVASPVSIPSSARLLPSTCHQSRCSQSRCRLPRWDRTEVRQSVYLSQSQD